MRIRSLIALLTCLILSQAGSAVTARDALNIPTLLPNTGGAAFIGKEFGETFRLLETRINKAGGVDGRPLHFDIQDTQSSPQVSVQLVNAALVNKPLLIIDGGPLSVCASVAPLMQNGPVFWCLSPSMHVEAGSYIYSVMAATRDSMIAGLNYFKSRGYKKIALLNGTDATGNDADAILTDVMKSPDYAGMAFVASEHFNINDLSVAAQVSRIKAAGAQALISFVTGSPLATVLHGLANAGLDIPVLTSGGNMSVAQLDGYKEFLPKELLFPSYAVFNDDKIADKGVQQNVDIYRSAMKSASLTPDMLHAMPWDPVLLMVDALKRAGPGAVPQQLRDAFSSFNGWPGILGRYDFHEFPNRGLGVRTMVISKWEPIRSTWSAPGKKDP